jgi:class 3 adenylate cyclase
MTLQGLMVGTVAYMAPEQALGRTPDARSDLYSLGAMLYEMVAGRPPFLGDDAVGVISQHINTAPVAPSWHNPEVPRQLEDLILRLLAKRVDDRPSSAGQVASELRQVLNRSTEEPAAGTQPPQVTDLRKLDWGHFVGRHEEMSTLKEALENVLSGKLALVVLAGEPGIGKSRLLDEFGVYSSLRGTRVLVGRCYEGEQTLPYRPFIDALGQYVRASSDEALLGELSSGAPEVATLVSEIRARFPDLPDPPRLEGEAERVNVFDAITQFLRSASRSQPIALHLDDLHWADKPSLLLLQHLARHLPDARVILVGTYRDVELDRTHALSETLTELRRLPGFRRIAVRGLAGVEVEELLSSMDGSEEGRTQRHVLASALHRETEGNPFFIHEVLAHLVETGKLAREDGRWVGKVSTVSALGIPEGVREVIGRRLSNLSEACNRMLVRASTMTRGFDWPVLRAISSIGEEELLDLLDEALSAQVLIERREGGIATYDFTHALIRQTLYEERSGPRRILLHREVGAALEDHWANEIESHVGALAYHFFQAAPGGDVEKAIDYCTRAGDRAMSLYGWDDAIGHYDRAISALELMQPVDESRHCQMLLKLSDALWAAGDYTRARSTAYDALELARAAGDDEAMGRSALNVAGTLPAFGSLVRNQKVVDSLEEALARMGERHNSLRARIMARLAEELAMDSDHQRRWALSRTAIDLARRSGDPRVRAAALRSACLPLWSPDTGEERMSIARELIPLGSELGDPTVTLDGYNWLFLNELAARAPDGSALAQSKRIVAEIRQPYYTWTVHHIDVELAILEGRLSEALTMAQEGLRMGQEAANENAALFFGVTAMWISHLQGRLPDMGAALSTALAMYNLIEANLRSARLLYYCEAGQDKLARAELDYLAGGGDFQTIPMNLAWLFSMAVTSEGASLLADRERARILYTRLAPYADQNVTVAHLVPVGAVAYYLGLLAATLDDWAAAERHFAAALARAREMNAKIWIATTQLAYARMLCRRGMKGLSAKALELLTEALEIAERCGMGHLLEECVALKLQIQGVDLSDLNTSIDRIVSSLQGSSPDYAAHAAPDGTVTILFSDIEGSAALADRLGDRRFIGLLREHNTIVRLQLKAFGGFEVKNEGDGFMVAFRSASKAVECAAAIQAALTERNMIAAEPIRVRVGLHAGEVIREGDDFFGRNVIMAARVASQAIGGEILASSVIKALLSGSDINWGNSRTVELKGLSGQHEIWPVEWSSGSQ